MTHAGLPTVRTIVFGIDAICDGVLSRLPPGTTPSINAIRRRGASGALESQLPPWTPSAWPSLYTGVNPGKHGVYGFLRFDGYDWSIVNGSDVREHAIWDLLTLQGLSSVIVNVPVTHPAKPCNGVILPGYTAPAEPMCYPRDLLEDVRDAIGGYHLYTREMSEGASKAERIDGFLELIGMRGKAFRYLLEREQPEFGFVQFQQSDTIFHEFPSDSEAIEQVYARIDEEIARTLDAVNTQTVMIVSDHGIGPIHGFEVRPNTILRDNGYVLGSTEWDLPSWTTIARNGFRDGSNNPEDSGTTAVERLLTIMARMGITSQRIGDILKRVHLDTFVLRFVPSDIVNAARKHIDFAQSTAYMRDRIELGIRINLEDREPAGVVSRGDYERVRTEIIDIFSTLETPDGKPAFELVCPREEIFHGPYVDEAPDIVLVPRKFDHFISASLLNDSFDESREPWNHKFHGLVAIAGDSIDSAPIENAHILDIAPTVLASLDIPPSDRMDGTVLPVLDDVTPIEYSQYQGERKNVVSESIEQRLTNLGYLE